MTVEEAKAKLVEAGVDQERWVVEATSKDSTIGMFRIRKGRTDIIIWRDDAEELSNALRSALYGVNCPRCTWTHSDAVPECPPQEVS